VRFEWRELCGVIRCIDIYPAGRGLTEHLTDRHRGVLRDVPAGVGG